MMEGWDNVPANANNGATGNDWALWVVVPADVDLALVAQTGPTCSLRRFELPGTADVAVWACRTVGHPLSSRLDATRRGETRSILLSPTDPDPLTSNASPAAAATTLPSPPVATTVDLRQ